MSTSVLTCPGARNSGDGKADPSVLAVFQDYVRLMPLVAEANQMSEELKKVRARKWHRGRSRREPAPLPLPSFLAQTGTQRPGEVRCFARDPAVSL